VPICTASTHTSYESPRPSSSSSDGSENDISASSNIATATLQDEEANAIPLDATQSEEPVQECSNQHETSQPLKRSGNSLGE
jgi:hypothetical protein